MVESKVLVIANEVMHALDRQPRHNPKLTDYELLSIVKEYTGDNTLQLIEIHDAVSYLELQNAVNVDRFMGTVPPAFDHVKISIEGRASFQVNRDWPKRAPSPKPEYHCKKCDAIVNPTDEKCPNGHDLSIVGKMSKLTLTEGLTLSDSVDLSSSFVINEIESIVKDFGLGPKTPEIRSEVFDYIKERFKDQEDHTREIKEEFKTKVTELFDTRKNLDKEKSLTLRMRYASGISGLGLFLVGAYGLIWIIPNQVAIHVSGAYISCLMIGAFSFLLSIRPESISGKINLGTK